MVCSKCFLSISWKTITITANLENATGLSCWRAPCWVNTVEETTGTCSDIPLGSVRVLFTAGITARLRQPSICPVFSQAFQSILDIRMYKDESHAFKFIHARLGLFSVILKSFIASVQIRWFLTFFLKHSVQYVHTLILDCPTPMPAHSVLFITSAASNGIWALPEQLLECC